MPLTHFTKVQRGLSWFAFLLLLLLTFVTRTYNRSDIFHNGGIYFIEGDCYARMTRVQMVLDGKWIIKKHEFENWPEGITAHTTAPLDWMIALLKKTIDGGCPVVGLAETSLLRTQTLDLAGALISPILGVFTAAWLWWICGRLRLKYRGAGVLFFALSPILVHGTLLGRPDHQSLLILSLAVALGAELKLSALLNEIGGASDKTYLGWQLTAGLAWAFSLWVSLYEPLILLMAVLAIRSCLDRRIWREKWRWISFGVLLVLSIAVEGWRLSWPDPTAQKFFAAWAETIGELRHLSLRGSLIWFWFGALWILVPVGLWIAGKHDRRMWGLAILVVLTLGLSVWQMRWGYFCALILALSLPWALEAVRKPWLAWIVGCALICPVAGEWGRRLHPGEDAREQKAERQASDAALRNVALNFRSLEQRAFLAPWWISPRIAYWSRQSGVAGTSHESLAGIVDTARFFSTSDPVEAAGILKKRNVSYVVVHDEELASNSPDPDAPRRYPAVVWSAKMLGIQETETALGNVLAESPFRAPAFLKWVKPEELGLVLRVGGPDATEGMTFHLEQRYKLYRVLPEKLNP